MKISAKSSLEKSLTCDLSPFFKKNPLFMPSMNRSSFRHSAPQVTRYADRKGR